MWQTNPSHIGTVVFDSVFFEIDDPTGDPDGDGSNNLEEFQYNTDPTDPASRVPLTMVVTVTIACLLALVGLVPRTTRIRQASC